MADPTPETPETVAVALAADEAPALTGEPARGATSATPAGSWLRAWVTGALVATAVESCVGLTSSVPFSAPGVALVLGLYVLTALAGAGATRALEWLAAPGGLTRASAAARATFALGQDPKDRNAARAASATLGMLMTSAIALCLFTGLGASFIQAHARADDWVAFAVAAAALPTLGAALVAGLAVRRALLAAPRLPRPAHLALASTLIAAGALLALAWARHETLAHLGAHALVAPTLLVLVALTSFVLVPRGLPHPARVGLALALAASVMVLVSWRAPRARGFTSRGTWSAAYMVAGLQTLSDLDRDGVASVPFGADCAPLDPTRHPLARELPGNGVDENCDGQDTAVDAAAGAGATNAFVPLSGEQPDLYLITVDALRADHLGFMGYTTHPTSPDLDALAETGVVFERAYSQDSGTAPSMWSLMVGKTPFQVDLVADGFPPNYADSETTLAERLKAAGYTTHARLCGSLFTAEAWNLKRGFDEFDEVCRRRPRDLGPYVLDSARDLLAPPLDDPAALSAEAERPPRFVWLHFFDPHHPYVDHADLRFGDQSVDLYDEEIRYVQTFVAEALRLALDDEHVRPRFVVLSADHGENFNEHGRDPHARTLYREVTHVPLVVLGSDLTPRRVEEPVALGDVFPTLLHLAGVPTPSSATMETLVPVLLGGSLDPTRPIFQENSWSRPTRHVKALIRGRYHLIRDLTSDTLELYDLLSDPRERVNRADTDIPEQAELTRLLDAFIATTHIPEAYQ